MALVVIVAIGLSVGPAAAADGSVADDCQATGAAVSYQAYARDVANPVAAVRGNRSDPVLNKVRAYYRGIAVQDRGWELKTLGCAAPAAAAQPGSDAVKAIATYRAGVQEQADALVPIADALVAAVERGEVARAKVLYAAARARWDQVSPVAAQFADLESRVDLREVDLAAGQDWTGWHRVEKALWTDGDLAGLVPVADQLAADVRTLAGRVPTSRLSVSSIGTGAKELLDGVVTEQITGAAEVFSHLDLVDTQASLDGARAAYMALRPLVSDRDLRSRLDAAFVAASRELAAHRARDGFASYETVGLAKRRELARVVDGLGEPLSQLTAAAVGRT